MADHGTKFKIKTSRMNEYIEVRKSDGPKKKNRMKANLLIFLKWLQVQNRFKNLTLQLFLERHFRMEGSGRLTTQIGDHRMLAVIKTETE